MQAKYKRILLKLSGEALAGDKKFGFDDGAISEICDAIKAVVDLGVEVGIVVGGGNFWRGRSSGDMDRIKADHIGMLATAMNALAVSDALEQKGVCAVVQTAISMPSVAEPYIRNKAVSHLGKGKVVIFGCGTGNPFFSTDTAAALRSVEIGAEIILKASVVDGVYDKDPHVYDDAVKYDRVTYGEVLEKGLKVMDGAAAALCRDNKMPIMVFDMQQPENLIKAITGEGIGTIVCAD